MPCLVVIYGPPLAGKSTLAWDLARSLPGKTAVVSADQLLAGSIAVPDTNVIAELEMVHTQMRLITAQYLKNRYNVVVEGPFFFEREGVLHNFESEIDQLVALMRNLAHPSLLVRLDVADEALVRRTESTGRGEEMNASRRIRAAYKPRGGTQYLIFDTEALSTADMTATIRENI